MEGTFASSEQRRELAIRADTVRGIFMDQDPMPGRGPSDRRIARVGSRVIAGKFDPVTDFRRHSAALLLGVDWRDAKWLFGAGIPTPLVDQLGPLAEDWLADDEWGDDHTSRWVARLQEAITNEP